MKEQEVCDFDTWLRSVCFRKPTPEAEDLARCAWDAATNKAKIGSLAGEIKTLRMILAEVKRGAPND